METSKKCTASRSDIASQSCKKDVPLNLSIKSQNRFFRHRTQISQLFPLDKMVSGQGL
jgi:hypothetical protein